MSNKKNQRSNISYIKSMENLCHPKFPELAEYIKAVPYKTSACPVRSAADKQKQHVIKISTELRKILTKSYKTDKISFLYCTILIQLWFFTALNLMLSPQCLSEILDLFKKQQIF